MALAQLLKNPEIVKKSLSGDARSVRVDFVVRRVRRLIALHPNIGDPSRPGDLREMGMPFAATELMRNLPMVETAFTTIWTRVTADAVAGRHVKIGKKSIRARVIDRPPAGNGPAMRRRLVLSIVHQACAYEIALADPANIERLHRIVDRRLRIAERMMFEVGRYPELRRNWFKNDDGAWLDGLTRAFEYPRRIRTARMVAVCRPDEHGVCASPLKDWELGDTHLLGPIRTNSPTTDRWRLQPANSYELDYTPTAGGAPKAVDAINGLFETWPEYRDRNLLFCDHVIHALHIEALVFAEGKRQPAGDPTWLDSIVKPGWLRLAPLMHLPGQGNAYVDKFLGGRDEPRFFEHTQVTPRDLQIGDHLIIYNHPAYDHAIEHGAWRLENAIVVQTVPGLLLQGHGTRPLTIHDAKTDMIKLFRAALDLRCADVKPLARVQSSAGNVLTLDRVGRLRVGMPIEIVDAKTEALLAADLKVKDIDPSKRKVTYDGAVVAATAKHVVRRRRELTPRWGEYESIAIGSRPRFLLRRVKAEASDYAEGPRQYADWHVAWKASDREDMIRQDPARAKLVQDNQLIFYTVEKGPAGNETVGWFPLFQPLKDGKVPRRRNGKITHCQLTSVGPAQIAPWTWFADPAGDRSPLPVVRPKVT